MNAQEAVDLVFFAICITYVVSFIFYLTIKIAVKEATKEISDKLENIYILLEERNTQK